MGWLNIYASVYQEGTGMNIFDFSLNSGKQLVWIGSTIIIFFIIVSIDFQFYESISYILYGIILVMLIFVILFGTKVSGARSWFEIGSFFKIQPSEFAKFITALAVARFISTPGFRFSSKRQVIMVSALVVIPILLILLQPDPGTALIYFSFLIVFYREGLSPLVIVIGLLLVLIFISTLFVNQLFIILAIVVIAGIAIAFADKTVKKIAGIIIIMLFTIGITRKGFGY
jgi:rod shape determining protein RodA